MTPYYSDDAVTIYHGDCRDLIDGLVFDVIVTDPPYGVGFAGKRTKHTVRATGGYTAYDDTPENVAAVVVPALAPLLERGARAVITPGRASMFLYPTPRTVGAIFYPSGAGAGPWGFTCSQPIYYYGSDPYLAKSMGSRPDSFSTTEAAGESLHPCPKPIRTMRWLVLKASLPGETVLDPFMGSGTTLRAAKDCGRKAIGVEIDERYCEIAAKRMGQEVLAL